MRFAEPHGYASTLTQATRTRRGRSDIPARPAYEGRFVFGATLLFTPEPARSFRPVGRTLPVARPPSAESVRYGSAAWYAVGSGTPAVRKASTRSRHVPHRPQCNAPPS